MKSESEAKNAGLSGGSTRHRKAMTWAIILVALVVALILILPATAALAAPVVKEGSTHHGHDGDRIQHHVLAYLRHQRRPAAAGGYLMELRDDKIAPSRLSRGTACR